MLNPHFGPRHSRPFRQPREDQPLGRISMNYHHPELCPDCRKVHSGSHQCRITCQYCHDIHFKKDLIENICPTIYPFAKQLQQKHSFQCKNCKGEGSYSEQIQTVRYQSTKKYQDRLKEWVELQQNELNQHIPKPELRVIYRDSSKKDMECRDCEGKGRIMRMITCCTGGCVRCSGDKYIINPIWKKYRREPILNEEPFQCPICLGDVDISCEKYVLHCRHEFHPDCIFRWLKESKKCPVCRQHDFYMQSELLEQGGRYPERQQPGYSNFYPRVDMDSDQSSWM